MGYLETQLTAQKEGLSVKLPDIESALALVELLIEKREKAEACEGEDNFQVKYNLAENVYGTAQVPSKQNTVMLWLGASVLLEYTLDEAKTLLEKNLASAKDQLEVARRDGRFVRSQITTTEVNIARVHNHGVLLRQKEEEKQASMRAGGKDEKDDE